MAEEHNIRFPSQLNVRVTLDNTVMELLRGRELALGPMVEPEDPLEDLMWLIQKGIHMTFGKAEDNSPYVRVMPIAGMSAVMYSGQPLERSLSKLRREIERLLEGRQPTGRPPGQ